MRLSTNMTVITGPASQMHAFHAHSDGGTRGLGIACRSAPGTLSVVADLSGDRVRLAVHLSRAIRPY